MLTRPGSPAPRARGGRARAGLVAALVGLATTVAGTLPAAAVEPDPRAARPAPELSHSVGVAVHLAYADTPYADAGRVADALRDLGVWHVRDDLFLDAAGEPVAAQSRALGMLADRGVRATLITGNPGTARGGNPGARPVQDYVDAVVGDPDVRRATELLEGTNEWDLFSRWWGDPTSWAGDVVARQGELVDAVAAEPSLAGVGVLSPSLAFGWDNAHRLRAAAATSGTSLGSVANAHYYPGGWKPTGTWWPIADMLAGIRALVPGAPLVVTETGYHDALATADGHHPVPADVAATYLTRLPADHLLAGVSRSYVYELFDQHADTLDVDPEQSFGLLRHDGTPKPAYRGLRSLLRLVEDFGTPRTGRLAHSLSGETSDTRRLLLRKSDGRYVLLLWRDTDVWDADLRRALPDDTGRVVLNLARRRAVRVYEPTTGCTTPVSGRRATRRIAIDVDASITAVVIGGRRAADHARPLAGC